MSDNRGRGGPDPVIAFEQVEKGFNGRKVLDKVSFSVARGEVLCILGRSGTGKSVTLKLMIGLLNADAGKVLVEGEDMATLSGGMQKRAGLARALVLKPEILLVDEPSSGLDRITAGEIDALLMKVKTECHTTMVIVTHDVHGARKIGDRFAVLDQSRLLAFGTPEELDGKQDNRLLQQFISER